MLSVNQAKQRTLGAMLAEWWRTWRQQRTALAELENCSSEVKRVAHDLALTPGELRVIAAKRPDAADLLPHRLAALDLDPRTLAVTEGVVLRDLQRLCTICESKGRCARDLADDTLSSDWRDYCPNAETLKSLVNETEEKKHPPFRQPATAWTRLQAMG